MVPKDPSLNRVKIALFEYVITDIFAAKMLIMFQGRFTAIFILVVSSAVLLHDVSARACDVSMGIAVFPIG